MSRPPIKAIFYHQEASLAEKTAAHSLAQLLQTDPPRPTLEAGHGLNIGLPSSSHIALRTWTQPEHSWLYARINNEGMGLLTASSAALLYGFVHLFVDGLTKEQYEQLETGLVLPVSFSWNRPLYDTTLTQIARTTRNFDDEHYVEFLARSGFTHLEVNGLAFHTAFERSVPGEYYSQFYSYGPGLMQFVDSELTRGLYDISYLQANLNRLKKLAYLGKKYGLKPGLLAYEPRTLPEPFFQKYPTLRGARVDHPFRSRRPRYTLAQDHPVSRAHYRELVQNLLNEVPDLAYLSVWTNDSGSGFEHTASLYSGRNGGPYLIREWRSHEKIARAAGKSATRWLRLIQESAADINPNFEVSLRIEPFKVEHDTIIEGLGHGLTFEAPSLLVHGYELPYQHPYWPENDGIAGSMFHTSFVEAEQASLSRFRSQDIEPIVQYAPCSTFNMEPLLGIPYPRLLYKKLQALKELDIRRVSAIGGLLNPQLTPYWPHPEVIRQCQFNGEAISIDNLLHRLARQWAGETYAAHLVEAWDAIESALSYMPYLPLFSNFGFVWYRLWIRPFVPNIEAIPKTDRAYYERFMVTMANNSNMNDLGKDVLFQLVDATSGKYMADAFDREVLPRFNKALVFIEDIIEKLLTTEHTQDATSVFKDLLVRAKAARCWAMTQRNLCHWVTNVYGFLDTDDAAQKAKFKEQLQTMIDDDIENTASLLNLWHNSTTEFMLISGVGETSYIYGENFAEQLQRKIDLTQAYRDHDPFIDRDIIWRID